MLWLFVETLVSNKLQTFEKIYTFENPVLFLYQSISCLQILILKMNIQKNVFSHERSSQYSIPSFTTSLPSFVLVFPGKHAGGVLLFLPCNHHAESVTPFSSSLLIPA
jgi:hypothetical protein